MTAEATDHSSKNPHCWWQNPIRAWRWKRVQDLHREFSVDRVFATDFELKVLVPELRGRAEYMKEVFQRIKDLCRDPELPILMGPILGNAIAGRGTSPVDTTEVARDYLARTETMVDEEFLAPLQVVISEPEISNVDSLTRFLQRMLHISESIRATEDKLFLFRFKAQVYFTNPETGVVTVGPPRDHDAILSHFKVYIGQLVGTADATSRSIEHWREQRDKARKPFLELVAADMNARTSHLIIVIQLLAILLALSFSFLFLTARDPFSLWRENDSLKRQGQVLQRRLPAAPPTATPALPWDGGARL